MQTNAKMRFIDDLEVGGGSAVRIRGFDGHGSGHPASGGRKGRRTPAGASWVLRSVAGHPSLVIPAAWQASTGIGVRSGIDLKNLGESQRISRYRPGFKQAGFAVSWMKEGMPQSPRARRTDRAPRSTRRVGSGRLDGVASHAGKLTASGRRRPTAAERRRAAGRSDTLEPPTSCSSLGAAVVAGESQLDDLRDQIAE